MAQREIRQYYSGIKHFYGVYDEFGRQNPADLRSREALEAWQLQARSELCEILGLPLFEKCDPQPKKLETWTLDGGITAERVAISTAENVRVPLTVLVPDRKRYGGRRPVWLHTFGHGYPNAMADNFRPGSPAYRPDARPSLGPGGLIALAREGYLGIAFDSFGSGERFDMSGARREFMDIGADNPNNSLAVALGASLLGIEVWELMRALDYALSRDDCDGRAGVMGTSGGGHESLFFSAADPRVAAAATSVWFYGFKESLIGLPHNCSCNYVPGLFARFDCQDIAALIAPRALHVEAGIRDYLNGRKTGLGNMLIPYYDAQKAYLLCENPGGLSMNIFDGGHGCPTWDSDDEQAVHSGDGLRAFAAEALPL